MFEDIGQIAGLMQNLPKIKQEMERLQQRLGQVTADGEAGGGMVKIRANAKMEVLSCLLGEEAFKSGDRELLEDLITAAVNQALQKARQLAAEETTKMASSFGLPPGLKLPGLG